MYAASKHAALGLLRSGAVYLQDTKIRVNGFAPGPTITSLMDTSTAAQAAQGVHAEKVKCESLYAASLRPR